VAEGIGNIFRFDGGPASILWVSVEKHVEWSFRFRFVGAEVVDEAAQGFAGAQVPVGCWALTDLFSFDGVLLVGKGKRGSLDGLGEGIGTERLTIHVIHRCVDGGVDFAMDGKGDITEAEGLASGFSGVWRVEVLGGPK
jgi:hypothetical protein